MSGLSADNAVEVSLLTDGGSVFNEYSFIECICISQFSFVLTLLIVWKARFTFPAEKAVFREVSRMRVRLTLPFVFTMTVAVAFPDELKISVAALKSVIR